MTKILFSLLCFSLVNLSFADISLAKKTKRSSVAKKRSVSKKRAKKYRAYKSFYRRHIKRLKQKTSWSAGVFGGVSLSTDKGNFSLKPLGLVLAYHANSYVSLEARAFGSQSVKLGSASGLSLHEVKTAISFSGLVKVRKSVDKNRQFMPYLIGGYSQLSLTESEVCDPQQPQCDPDELFNDPVKASVGLWTVGLGLDFFPVRNFSLGVELLQYLGVEKALLELSDFNVLNIQNFNTVQVSARFYF